MTSVTTFIWYSSVVLALKSYRDADCHEKVNANSHHGDPNRPSNYRAREYSSILSVAQNDLQRSSIQMPQSDFIPRSSRHFP